MQPRYVSVAALRLLSIMHHVYVLPKYLLLREVFTMSMLIAVLHHHYH